MTQETESKALYEKESSDLKMLIEAARILKEARHAIRKIKRERNQGMGYYHAEVDWLVKEEENIALLLLMIQRRQNVKSIGSDIEHLRKQFTFNQDFSLLKCNTCNIEVLNHYDSVLEHLESHLQIPIENN